MLVVPMRWEGAAIGVDHVYARRELRPSPREIALLENFADQAVIAIENARLFNETAEALERQTATADVLKVIAASPSDLQPVFEALVLQAARLIGDPSRPVRFLVKALDLSAFAIATTRACSRHARTMRPSTQKQTFDRANRASREICTCRIARPSSYRRSAPDPRAAVFEAGVLRAAVARRTSRLACSRHARKRRAPSPSTTSHWPQTFADQARDRDRERTAV